jgi:hypothetical protein
MKDAVAGAFRRHFCDSPPAILVRIVRLRALARANAVCGDLAQGEAFATVRIH